MSIGLVMVVKDEAKIINRCLSLSLKNLIDYWTIVDTGSTDTTKTKIKQALRGVPGELFSMDWVDFGTNLSDALAKARGTADWLLRLDADMTIWANDNLAGWLASDPDPSVDAWMVEVQDHGLMYKLPLLMRGDKDWAYVGATHEYLDPMGRKFRPVTGLVVTHLGDGGGRETKLQRDLELLAPGVKSKDPRSIFYTAECYRYLGDNKNAIKLYSIRANMKNTWEEERWYAQFQYAKLSNSVEGLLKAHRKRPWRAEPLAAAAEIIKSREHDDNLFIER